GPEISISTGQPPEGLVRRDDVDPGSLPTRPGTVREEGSREISRPTHLETFKKPNILLRILAKIPEICENIVLLGTPALMKYMESRGMAREPYTFTMPGTHGRMVELDGHIGPKKIPKGMTHTEVQTQLQEKLDAGHKVLAAVTSGARTGGCTVDDMTNLMFFLQVRAEDQQGSSFKDGAFNLPDPDGRLGRFLDSCPQAYQRNESSAVGGGSRGIDADGSAKKRDQLLPHHMKSLKYVSVPPSDTVPEGRIILKMERTGKFFKGTVEKGGGLHVGGPPVGNRADLDATMGHVIKSGRRTPGPDAFSGHLPVAVKSEYRELMRSMPEAREALKHNDPFSPGGGIRVMYENAQRVIQGVMDGDVEVTPEALDKLNKFVRKLEANYPDPGVRFGNEVVFSIEDLISEPVPDPGPLTPPQVGGEPELEVRTPPPPPSREGRPPLSSHMTRDEEIAFEQMDAQMTSLQSDYFARKFERLQEKLQAKYALGSPGGAPPKAVTDLTEALGVRNALLADEPEVDASEGVVDAWETDVDDYVDHVREQLDAFKALPPGDNVDDHEIADLVNEIDEGLVYLQFDRE
ncbi:MAG TPA: hypothetical protein VK956_20350, partial [Verrucomicrobium sp.]|nr:hypothetical protein [Verrucomicrobium sp.]